MSARGCGVLGLRSGVVPLDALVDRAVTERLLVAHCSPQVIVPTTWEVYSGDVWRARWAFTLAGSPLEVAGVSTRAFTFGGLPRRLTLDQLDSNIGFFYDLDEIAGAEMVFDDVDHWDDGLMWDGAPWLYVNLGPGVSPVDEAVAVAVAVAVANRQADVPLLGDTLIPDGDFEAWPGSWVGVAGAGCTVEITADAYEGSAALAMDVGLAAAAIPFVAWARADHESTGVTFTPPAVGIVYALSGFYANDTAVVRGAVAVRDDTMSMEYVEDGRHVRTTSSGLQLDDTLGAWRYFYLEFRAASTEAHTVYIGASKLGPGLGRVRFDAVNLRPIYRWVRALNRFQGNFSIEASAGQRVFGGKSVGVSGVSMLNTDGVFDAAYRALTWRGAYVRVEQAALATAPDVRGVQMLDARVTRTVALPLCGMIPRGENRSDLRIMAAGLIAGIKRGSESVDIEVQDLRTIVYARAAALDKYQSDMPGNQDPRIYDHARPIVVGQVQQLEPARIDITASGDGIYEVANPDAWAYGIVDIDEIRLYADAEAAGRRAQSTSIDLLNVGGAISKNLAACRFTALTSIKPFLLDTSHEYLSFTRNGTTYHARILAGSEQNEVLSPTANGADTDCVVFGAPTQWQALVSQDSSRVRTASSVAANSYISVVLETAPTATSIPHVEVRAIWWREGPGYDPDANDTVTLGLRRISTGVRYESGTFWKAPPLTPTSGTFRWETAPHDSSPWTNAKLADYEAYIHYRTASNPGYLNVDVLDAQARLFLATPPSASEPGMCIPLTLAQRAAAAMTALAAATVTVTWDNTTKKLTFASSGATTFTLLTSSGKQPSAWGWVGANTSADRTGALTYTMAQAIYVQDTDIDTPILRVELRGYRDTPTGTYTGVPSSLIASPPDVLRFLLVEVFRLPAAMVDVASFVRARAYVDRTVALLITDDRTVADVIDAQEFGALADAVFAPDALRLTNLPVRLQFRPYSQAMPQLDLATSDFIDLADSETRDSVAARVDVSYGRSMAIRGLRTVENPDAGHVARQTAAVTIETDLLDGEGAQAVADALAPLLASPRYILGSVRRGSFTLLTASDQVRASFSRRRQPWPGSVRLTGPRPPSVPGLVDVPIYEGVRLRLVKVTHQPDANASTFEAMILEEP